MIFPGSLFGFNRNLSTTGSILSPRKAEATGRCSYLWPIPLSLARGVGRVYAPGEVWSKVTSAGDVTGAKSGSRLSPETLIDFLGGPQKWTCGINTPTPKRERALKIA